MELTEFLLARIGEDETVARAVIAANHEERDRYAARGVPDCPKDAEGDFEFTGPVDGPSGWASVYIGPARILAECEAKRRIVEEAVEAVVASAAVQQNLQGDGVRSRVERAGYTQAGRQMARVLRLLARPYADHPDYREEWRP